MKVARITRTGGPEVIELTDVPTPEPGEGEALVRIAAAGVNFVDVYHRAGRYPGTLPLVLGSEAAGVVEAVGPGVTGLDVGTEVVSARVPGAYAEAAVVPAERLVPVPDGLDLRTAAAVFLQGMTAHYLTTSTVALGEGDTVVVHAAAGGVGLLLTQLAARRGATVIGTVSTAQKAALAREAGAAEVVNYTEADFTDVVRARTDGRGADVVYDSVGRDTFDAGLSALRPRGHLVLYGQASGPVPPLDPQRLARGGSLFLTRPMLNDHIATRDELLWRAGEVLTMARDGDLRVRIGETHPLADAAHAHERLESRATTGKVLLIP